MLGNKIESKILKFAFLDIGHVIKCYIYLHV